MYMNRLAASLEKKAEAGVRRRRTENGLKPLQSEHLRVPAHPGWFSFPQGKLPTPKGKPPIQGTRCLVFEVKTDKLRLLLEGGCGLAAQHPVEGTAAAQEEPQEERSAAQDAGEGEDT